MKYKISLGFLLLVFSCLSCADEQIKLFSMAELHRRACDQSNQSQSPWNVTYLYDCFSRKLFIPYQLWTGASWDGNKNTDCMHDVDHFFSVNNHARVLIKGPHEWRNPVTGKTEFYWQRQRLDKQKIQFFTCHENGIGRVFDSRGDRYFESGRCKFPAGDGWQLAIRKYCADTSIEITAIALHGNNDLAYFEFKWWYKSGVKYSLDYIYRYEPNYGMKYAWKQ